ncbi:AAA family ATPase [Phenylobacterium montanum]|uniref:AAA family ATPase n=1 Tax=Phenylobacterium montanum TaxID=2823693 RepID=A0A975FYT6_9CAUL|nr:AAA family ATPase [Caulobacter sp. S6]QUD87342.1 AAA family ATPase [Caulobacter sp. S6]
MRAVDARHYWISARFERREGWDAEVYPFNLPAVRYLEELVFHPKVTFLVGENGAGKSTLIEALAVAWGFNAEGGSQNFGFATRASHSELHRFVRPVRSARRAKDGFFLRAESLFNVATQVESLGVSGYGPRSLHEQSHGESFLALMDHRFRGDGLYILDEPEAALSPNRQLSFLVRMHELIGQRSQFIIATHSPIILGYPDAWIYQASADGLTRIDYEDTDHFQVARSFLNHRQTMLETLLAED